MQRGGNIYYYCYDGLGSVTEIADNSGDVIEKYKYDPFGGPLIIDPTTNIAHESSVVSNPYLFTGREYDQEINLYYYRARYYSYQTGRFIQADPMGYIDGTNLYIYSKNNPINLVDPSGTSVRVCYTDIIPCTGIKHTFIFVGGGPSHGGSWGFDTYNDDKETCKRVLKDDWVPAKVRPNEYYYQINKRGKKPKCKIKVKDHSKDQCVYTAAWADVWNYTGLPYNLYRNNCYHWRDKILRRCGISVWEKGATANFNDISTSPFDENTDTSK